ncbi:MAG: 50S ribosomal protein L17 [Patescibacteria group bacterium]
MRHHKKTKKLGRTGSARKALVKGLLRSFFLHGSIRTTETRAKTIKPLIERLITVSKTNTITHRRLIIQKTGSRIVAQSLLNTIGPKYQSRKGGYTRITKLGKRKGDDASVVILSYV